MANWYCGSTKWTAVTAWAASTAYSVGDIRRQNAAPTAGNERVFRCTTAGTSGGTEPTWTITAGGTTNDNTVVWTEITGQAAYNGDGGGTAWAAPAARIETLLATGWMSAGDTLFVSNNHAESWTSTRTLSIPGTSSATTRIICVDDANVPANNFTSWATTGTFTITSASSVQIVITGSGTTTGTLYMYGLSFSVASSGASSAINLAAPSTRIESNFEQCKFILANNSTNPKINIGQSAASSVSPYSYMFKNCTVKFANAGQGINFRAGFVEFDGLTVDSAGTAPTTLFLTTISSTGSVFVHSSDLSKVTGNLVDLSSGGIGWNVTFANSKLGSGVTMYTGTISNRALWMKLHNCDSTSANYRYYYADYNGTIQQETTTVITGEASDGTTPISWNMTTSANSKMEFPLTCEEFAIWNDTTGSSKTATVEIAGASSLTNADIWMEAEYLGNSSFPISSIVSSGPTNLLTAGSTLSTSSKTWGGSPANKQYMSVSFTPQMKGYVKIRVFLAKASYTAYVVPDVYPLT